MLCDLIALTEKCESGVLRRKVEKEQTSKRQELLKYELKREQERHSQETLKELRPAREQALEEDGKVLETILAIIELDERIKQKQRREKRRRVLAKRHVRDDGCITDEDNDDREDAEQQSQFNGAVEVYGDDDDGAVIENDAIENSGAQQTSGQTEQLDDNKKR